MEAEATVEIFEPFDLHYSDLLLLSSPPSSGDVKRVEDLTKSVMGALGRGGPGLLCISGVPGAFALRRTLLPLARRLALLPPPDRSHILKEASEMKRAEPCEQGAEAVSSNVTPDSDSNSDSDSDSDSMDDISGGVNQKKTNNISQKAKGCTINASSAKRRGIMDFNALSRHGYRGGPSVLRVPEPKVEQDWSWSKGKREEEEEAKESYDERERTRTAASAGENLTNIQKRQPPGMEKGMSFSQKEKRKRDLGQASRGKSYVEEEKRLLRESGVYSGFDA